MTRSPVDKLQQGINRFMAQISSFFLIDQK